MKLKYVSVALLAASSLLVSSCVYGPVDGYGTFSYSTNGYNSSVAWTSASYDANGFPIFGYSYGRPVYGYTEAGVAIFTVAALTALCFVPHWKPAPWYHGHWHYPAHIHRCAAPPRFPHGHRPGHRPAGGMNAPIHRDPGSVFRPHSPNGSGIGHQPNRPNMGHKPGPNNKPNIGNRPAPGGKPNMGGQPGGNRPNMGSRPGGNRPNMGGQSGGNRPNAGANRPNAGANRPAGNRPNMGSRPQGNRPTMGGQPGGSRPNMAARPASRPNMGARPSMGARPAGGARPASGGRPGGGHGGHRR